MDFDSKYNSYKQSVENQIRVFADQLQCHDELKGAITYSLFAGGKRIRPVMFLACLDMLGVEHENYLPLAVAIECIHTYSLIHDDLPSMDNDDYRRGRLSNHKVFGEGMAILAGDALLNCAIELALNSVCDINTFNAVKYLFECAGVHGMINGQAYDLYYEDKVVNNQEQLLLETHQNKTGKLLTAPLIMASYIAGEKHYDQLLQLGILTGKLFQFCDDLLDVTGEFKNLGKTIGKDGDSKKLTAISVYGKEGTQKQIDESFLSIIKILKMLDNNSFFMDFYAYIKNRKN